MPVTDATTAGENPYRRSLLRRERSRDTLTASADLVRTLATRYRVPLSDAFRALLKRALPSADADVLLADLRALD